MKLTKEYVAQNPSVAINSTDIGKGVVASKEVAGATADTKVYEATASRDAYITSSTYADTVHYWAVVRNTAGAISDAELIDSYIKNVTGDGFDLCTNYEDGIPALAARSRKNQEIAEIKNADRTSPIKGANDIVCSEVILSKLATITLATDFTAETIIATAYNKNIGEEYMNW